jgi:hypothetical protein
MKNKFLLVALIGVIMAVGVVLVSCKNDPPPCENNCSSNDANLYMDAIAACEDYVGCVVDQAFNGGCVCK